jgi:hypothetical protein
MEECELVAGCGDRAVVMDRAAGLEDRSEEWMEEREREQRRTTLYRNPLAR